MADDSALPRPAAILVNAAAGSARAARTRIAVELVRRGLDADLLSVDTRDARELAAQLRDIVAGYRTLVVAGGDGTLGVAYNVLAGGATILGYVPAGFGNATAHLLRLPRQPEALAATILAGHHRPIDLLRVGDQLALFAGAGWDALVAGRYADAGARGTLGWARAIAGALPALARRRVARLTVDDEVVFEGPMEMLVAGTSPWFGRGLLVNAGARADLGRIRIRIYAGPAPRLALDAVRWVARRGASVPYWDARHAGLDILDGGGVPLQADGDRIGEQSRWTFGVAPAAIRIIGDEAGAGSREPVPGRTSG